MSGGLFFTVFERTLRLYHILDGLLNMILIEHLIVSLFIDREDTILDGIYDQWNFEMLFKFQPNSLYH